MFRSWRERLEKDKIFGSRLFQYVKSKEKEREKKAVQRDSREKKKRETRLVVVDFVKEPLLVCVCMCMCV